MSTEERNFHISISVCVKILLKVTEKMFIY